MAVILSDSRNVNYDGKLSTANSFYRVEAHNLAHASTTAVALSTLRTLAVTFANAGNCQGIILCLSNTSAVIDRDLTVRLQEAINVSSFNTSTERVNITGHGFSDGQVVTFSSTGTLPTGITAASIYYVINSTANDFQISTTAGGSVQGLSGTPSGTATCWPDRASSTVVAADILGQYTETGVAGYDHVCGYVPFKFSTPYAVDTTASKWRFHMGQYGGTAGTWYSLTSDTTSHFYATWCDNVLSHTDNDTMIVVDKITIDKTFTLASVLGTGDTVNATAGIVCRNTDYSIDNVALLEWENPAAASYTFTLKGNLYFGAHSGFRAGTAASPIASAEMGSIYFDSPNVGSTGVSRFMYPQGASSATINIGKASFFIYGEIPAVVKTSLAADVELSATSFTTTDTTGWVNGDTIVIGKSDVNGQGNTSTYTVSSTSGTTVNLTGGITSYRHKSGGAVFKMNGYGFKMSGASNSIIGSITTANPSNFTAVGCELVDCRFSITAGSYYYVSDDDEYTSKYTITDVSSRVTSTTNSTGTINTLFCAKKGSVVSRVYSFRAPFLGVVTGYASSLIQSGYCDVEDNVCIGNYSTTNLGSTTTTRINVRRNIFENGYRYGYDMQGINASYTDNVCWGIAGLASSQYYTVSVKQVINPEDISGNTFDNCSCALYFSNSVTLGCDDYSSTFGLETANTIDIFIPGGSVTDYTFHSPEGLTTIDTLLMPDCISGSKIRITDDDTVANADRVYAPEGLLTRCGYGLADTTVWTGSTFGAATPGQFSLKMRPDLNAATLLTYSQDKTLGDITGLTMTVSARVKINSTNYYAGTHTNPTLRVMYDGNTEVTSVATDTTDPQQLLVSFVPTTNTPSITVIIEAATDASGTNADFYVGQILIPPPEGTSVDTQNFGLWNKAMPLPSISTIPAPGTPWNEAASAYVVSGTMGAKLNHVDEVVSNEIE